MQNSFLKSFTPANSLKNVENDRHLPSYKDKDVTLVLFEEMCAILLKRLIGERYGDRASHLMTPPHPIDEKMHNGKVFHPAEIISMKMARYKKSNYQLYHRKYQYFLFNEYLFRGIVCDFRPTNNKRHSDLQYC